MSYEEKHNYTSFLLLVFISIPYLIYVLGRYGSQQFASAGDEVFFWTSAVLFIIPIRIVAEIITHIIMAIINAVITGKEDLDTSSDERDKLIELKSIRNAYFVFCITMGAAILIGYFTRSLGSFFATIFLAGTITELVEIASKTIYYRKSIQ